MKYFGLFLRNKTNLGKQTESFDLLNNHLAFIHLQSRPSFPERQAQSQQNQTFSQPLHRPSLQCYSCGKTFGSENA